MNIAYQCICAQVTRKYIFIYLVMCYTAKKQKITPIVICHTRSADKCNEDKLR